MKVYELIPDADVLIHLAPEELAHALLQIATANLQNGQVHRDSVISIDPEPGRERPYPPQQQRQVEIALVEALHWLEVNALLLPAPGINGQNGFRVFGRRGRELIDRGRFDAFQRAAAFPKSLIHPAIADRVWISLARGELADAVFIAFRTVEEQVRLVGHFTAADVGVDLMRRAFHPENGPLTDRNQPLAEREALAHLFAGAIGSYKNPHSHRTVTINDHVEAQEMVMLASHLLRIIDSRR
jgi:uncharacterized protein (TIGR02391 family)